MSSEAAAAPIPADPTGGTVPARPRRRWEAADTLIAASVGLVAIIVAVFVFLCVQGYYSTIETTKTRGQTAASVVAEGSKWVVSSALAMANGVAGSIGDDAAQADAVALAIFNDVTGLLPSEVALGIYDASGALVANASSPNVPGSIAQTEDFAALSAGADWTISPQDRDEASGKATFSVLRRLGGESSFRGVVMITIDAAVLEELARAQNIGEGSTISIVRADGWVIARNPSLPQPLNLAGTPAFEKLGAGQLGSYVSAVSPADGQSRIVSFRHVDELGYIAVASISTPVALAPLWSAIWIVSWLIAPIALALLVGSLLTARLLRKTQSTSRSLSSALAHNEVLFREIHHRVKNNLQSINSLVQLQPIPREVKADMNQRIAAMSAVHEHIYRSDTFTRVQVKDYLHTLIENIRAGYNPSVQVVEELTDVTVEADAATPLGLIVNEVVSNAFKHAFTDGRPGTITIRLAPDSDGMARLTVRDNGVGFDPATPTKGIGRRLITGLTAQLKGSSTQSTDNGSVFSLVFPTARD